MLTEDGREQIMGYHMAGEIVGLDGISKDRYASQAVALEDSEVCVLPFDQLDDLAKNVTALRRNLYRFISSDICRDQNMMLLFGSMRAEERLALFLLNLAERYQARGYSSSEFLLRMTRRRNRQLSRLETGDRQSPVLAPAGRRADPSAGPRD